MAHPESDLAVARASVAEGIPLINSSKAMGDSYSGDIFQVLALDADAVLLGRPYVYALTVAGEQGVRELIHNYRAYVELTMGLSGCRSATEMKHNRIISR